MQRKLIKQGIGGLTLYVPKKWADKKGLKEGDLVEITEADQALIISSADYEKKEAVVDLQKINPSLRVTLTHLYRRGYDRMVFTHIDKNQIKEVKQITNKLLLGFEVTEFSEEACVVDGVSEPTEQKYDMLLRRIFLLIKQTQQLVHSDIKTGAYENESEIDEFVTQQEKYILFCRRILNKELYEKNPVLEWELLTFLLHIEHAYKYAYIQAKKRNIKNSTAIEKILGELELMFLKYYEAFYKKDESIFHEITKKKEEYFSQCYTVMEKGGDVAVLASHFRELFRLMQIGGSPIVSIIVDRD